MYLLKKVAVKIGIWRDCITTYPGTLTCSALVLAENSCLSIAPQSDGYLFLILKYAILKI